MKFAFSTLSAPTWDFETLVLRAKDYRYDGVEIRGFLNESVLTAANIFLTDLAKVRRIFGDGGIEICCLASSIAFANDRKRDAVLANDLKLFIDTAATVRCPAGNISDLNAR